MFIFSIRANGSTVIENGYDYMGRRYMKKVTVGEIVTLHQHYLYRGYLQIAALDLTRSNAPALWYLHWDPTQPVATRPLSLRKNGTWYTYGHDLTKNVTELYKADGTVTATGIDQPIQWSSEHYDPELALVYYNYRHYNPLDGRWINRDPIAEKGGRNLYGFEYNNPYQRVDIRGLMSMETCKKLLEKFKKSTETKRFIQKSTDHLVRNINDNKEEKRSCNINVSCSTEKCHWGWANSANRTYDHKLKRYTYTIDVFVNPCKHDSEGGLLGTFQHEVIHAYDFCVDKKLYKSPSMCRALLRSEIRANAYSSECFGKTGDSLINCIRSYYDYVLDKLKKTQPDCKNAFQHQDTSIETLYQEAIVEYENPFYS